MQQLILLVPAIGERPDYKKVKSEIRKYVGSRMVIEKGTDDAVPGILINELLSSKDKKTLSKIMDTMTTGALLFINVDSSKELKEYLTLEISDEE